MRKEGVVRPQSSREGVLALDATGLPPVPSPRILPPAPSSHLQDGQTLKMSQQTASEVFLTSRETEGALEVGAGGSSLPVSPPACPMASERPCILVGLLSQNCDR